MSVKLFRYLHFVSKNVFLRNSTRCSVLALCPAVEDVFNDQINVELFAGYNYLAMAAFFSRQNINLRGCYKFCMDQVQEEQEHAEKLINYVNERGGKVSLDVIDCPSVQDWESPVCVFKDALKLEDKVTEKILILHKVTEEYNDLASTNWLEENFLEEQVKSLDQISKYITILERMGSEGLAVQIFDEYLQEELKKQANTGH